MNYFGNYLGIYPGEWWGDLAGPEPEAAIPQIIRLRSMTERSRM